MHRERLNFESRSVSFPSAQHKGSFKRNSVRALKNTYRRPGGLEMILASVDDSLVLLSDLITTTRINDANLRNREQLTDNDLDWKNEKKVGNYDGLVEKSLSQSDSPETAKIDLTGEEIIQWLGGLPIINPNKMLAYFCGATDQETRNILPGREPYQIFSFTQKRQTNGQIINENSIHKLTIMRHIVLNTSEVLIYPIEGSRARYTICDVYGRIPTFWVFLIDFTTFHRQSA
ncbi:hypothetical protein LOAG_07618 [Loa loa]|uniref:Tub domain-containing protein n=1 Tax=Loa loa TaxID=7209 RepID=A0A1I7VW70_LOALO|nr:hypothetical protein LOAG_07618 [Loa loa]EFO20870.2 hypothetical protein LOAG_07618 [Loa loa]